MVETGDEINKSPETAYQGLLTKHFPDWLAKHQHEPFKILVPGPGVSGVGFDSLHHLFPKAKIWALEPTHISFTGLHNKIVRKPLNEYVLGIREKAIHDPNAYLDYEGNPLDFDFVYIRTPDIIGGDWERGFPTLIKYVNPSGIVHISVVSVKESENTRNMLQKQDVYFIEEPLKVGLPAAQEKTFAENFIFLAQKK